MKWFTGIEQALQAYWSVAFAGLFLLFALFEAFLAPGRNSSHAGSARLVTNFGLQIAQGVLALALPVSLAGIVLLAQQRGPGLMDNETTGIWLELPVLVAVRSLLAYWLHRLEHAWPLLWRFHRVHHSDTHVDLTTSLRHHPVEILPLMASYGAMLYVLSPDMLTFLLVEVLMLSNQLWQHANVSRSARFAGILGKLLVTPENHLVHHSAERNQTDSNFGTLLILWDRLFGTYVAPRGAGAFRIGLGDSDDAFAHDLLRQLWLPFTRAGGSR